jgi:hypothetical protein
MFVQYLSVRDQLHNVDSCLHLLIGRYLIEKNAGHLSERSICGWQLSIRNDGDECMLAVRQCLFCLAHLAFDIAWIWKAEVSVEMVLIIYNLLCSPISIFIFFVLHESPTRLLLVAIAVFGVTNDGNDGFVIDLIGGESPLKYIGIEFADWFSKKQCTLLNISLRLYRKFQEITWITKHFVAIINVYSISSWITKVVDDSLASALHQIDKFSTNYRRNIWPTIGNINK